jgi:hypothetical protein
MDVTEHYHACGPQGLYAANVVRVLGSSRTVVRVDHSYDADSRVGGLRLDHRGPGTSGVGVKRDDDAGCRGRGQG